MISQPPSIQMRFILDIMYPIGIVINFVNSTDPNQIMLGQTWEKLPGGYALTTTNNTGGGDASTANASNHYPGTSFQGGLPNITGTTESYIGKNSGADPKFSNAFYTTIFFNNTDKYAGYKEDTGYAYNIMLDASRSSDRYGTYQTDGQRVVADHISVVAWKRTF